MKPVFYLAVCLLFGCSGQLNFDQGLISRLNNRGPVALSSDNPYLAANLLISREMEDSTELQGFIKHRGAPAALELEKDFLSPLLLHFYYPENKELYSLEKLEDTWVIRGPFEMSRDKFKAVAKLIRTMPGGSGREPALNFPEDRDPLLYENRKKPYKDKVGDNEINYFDAQANPKEDPFIAKLDDYESTSHSSAAFRSPASRRYQDDQSLNYRIDTIIGSMTQQPAELTPKGDLVHYVTYPGETLSMIARWYTRDRVNAGRLARINRLKNPDQLEIGDVIIIPSYLIKNTNRLTEEAVGALIQAIQQR